ncbi:hypothetical protein [Parapedobacter indicus]|uniref:Uncharacterized protein n=1 Tax=Parapedobacter indicus TaxID=1477437 RepID=A0A1I3HN69_9SPHI|nr:hypothetical protein [Parapedobacter indicus]PPL03103.1 hypothetical protein CLV26_103429 [Parapedobacter indicus]SFI37102.1 hypothetical protein SAMN05444682_103428 [Parapedobacter indicus]
MSEVTKMPVWPGPCVLVPMTTDILLIGQPDFNSQTTWSGTKNNYYNLWMQQLPDSPQAFNQTKCPPVGAHVMWTLPYTLRKGSQQASQQDNAEVDFPFIPNRWLITRFQYGQPGVAPTVVARILQSDLLFDLGNNPNAYNQYPYPSDTAYPVRGIGQNINLDGWAGVAGPSGYFLQAAGPGDLAWSVGYDNIKNVLSLHDDLSADAAVYTYSIIGWYADPANDLLYSIPTENNDDWQQSLSSTYGWTLGDGQDEVTQAVDTWLAWQRDHGLQGPWDPAGINLPPQAKAAIVAWYNWQQQYGVNTQEAALPRQTICHSMVATVNWQGNQTAYGTGVPGGGLKYPKISLGNNSIESISTYMAHMVAENKGITDKTIINSIERVLEAFQKDLIFDLDKDPVKVEMLLHNSRFESEYSGQEWMVVRPENSVQEPTETAGQQSIPLNQEETDALTALNTLQDQLNDNLAQVQSLRSELFMLSIKSSYMGRKTPSAIVTAVNQSINEIKSQLSDRLQQYQELSQAVESQSAALQTLIGSTYLVKAVDRLPYSVPRDPVIMVAGVEQDSKLLEPSAAQENGELFVRITGQTVSGINVSYTLDGVSITETIGAAELLAAVNFPVWNAIPKEVMDIWVETLILDTGNATLIALLYFNKRGVSYTPADLSTLAHQIQIQQSAIWNPAEKIGVPTQTLGEVAGFNGLIPAAVGVSFRKGQPWTPIYMDWQVSWFPTSSDETKQLTDWKLGDIDYAWQGTAIPAPPNKLIFQGRAILNARVAKNIQGKFASFESDPNYAFLPQYMQQSLALVASRIGELDVLTQAMSGFTRQLTTQLMAMNRYPDDPEITALLTDTSVNYRPVTGGDSQPDPLPFFPIRSGHFQVIDLWVVDSFGQVLRGKDPQLGPESPIPTIYWSESIDTHSPEYSGKDASKYGQLPPRLAQAAQANINFLQRDNDNIPTNSSDLTNPICGWVMANHLDNSLMVFDENGENLGSVMKVQREVTDFSNALTQQYTIRWEAVPGSNTALGAPPELPNSHLQQFILGLLQTGLTQDADAYSDLLSAIDATLWHMSNFNNQNGNMALLLGRPLAVIRAEVALTVAGTPLYNQSWVSTGAYYNRDGTYDPVDPPYMGALFNVRVGDSFFDGNGVLGYFQDDIYHTFYAVYGNRGQTYAAAGMPAKAGGNRNTLSVLASAADAPGFKTDYVQADHVIALPANGAHAKLTLLVDPSGTVPLIPGSLPSSTLALPNGPVTRALNNIKTTFRAGPLLLDPRKIKMPTPAQVQGNWGWCARKDVTGWNPEVAIAPYSPVATLQDNAVKLIEGWITLSGPTTNSN